jgi:hypothetical protein
MLITLPSWFSSLPLIRNRIFRPKLMLRADPCLHVVRWGTAPDGQEWGFGSTVNQSLQECLAEYRSTLAQSGLRFMAPIEIEGTDFHPLPAKMRGARNA